MLIFDVKWQQLFFRQTHRRLILVSLSVKGCMTLFVPFVV